MKYIDVLRQEVWKQYRHFSLLGRMFCHLAQYNPDYSMFIAGIISGIPATLLMNLVTLNRGDVIRPLWYGILYTASFLASVVFCVAFFRLSVLHGELHKAAEKTAERRHGTETEKINALVGAFEERYPKQLRSVIFWLLGSMLLTVLGIVGTFLVQIL